MESQTLLTVVVLGILRPAGPLGCSLPVSSKRVCLRCTGKPSLSLRNSYLEQKLLFIKSKGFQATDRCG